MTFICEKCGFQIGNVVSATCAKHGPMKRRPIQSAGFVRKLK